jgi:hypothetical protein
MQIKTLPIARQQYIDKIGKTAVETSIGTVWANGDTSNNSARVVTIVINEVGDTFVAKNDSKTVDEKQKPLYRAGDTVTRQKQSLDFKSFDGFGSASEFVKSATAFGTQLIVQMS